MPLATTFIRNNEWIILLLDGTEIPFPATEALEIQHDLHEQYVDLVAIAHEQEPMFNARQATEIHAGDTVKVKTPGTFYGQEVKVFNVVYRQKDSERFSLLLGVYWEGVARPSWFEDYEVEKIEQEGREQML